MYWIDRLLYLMFIYLFVCLLWEKEQKRRKSIVFDEFGVQAKLWSELKANPNIKNLIELLNRQIW